MAGKLVTATQVPIPPTSLNMARRAMSDEEFARFQAVTLHKITYSSDALLINGWLALPPAGQDVYPAVIFNRGGTGARGVLTSVGAMSFIGQYAAWGYVGIASNYRGTAGSQGNEEWGAGDVDDAMNLIDVLDDFSYVDKERIGLVGGSLGGMRALMMLTRTDRFRAAVTFGAPTSIHTEETKAYIRVEIEKHYTADVDALAEAEKRSAVLWADRLCSTTPLLVLHGTGDRRVPPDHALKLGLELQHNKHPYKLIMYDNADHVLAGRRDESTEDVRWWLDHYVKNKAPLPKVGPHGA